MNTRKWILATSLIVALVIVVVALVPAVLAQGPNNGDGVGLTNQLFAGRMMVFNRQVSPNAGMMGQNYAAGPMMGRGGMWGGSQNSLVAVTAEVLGIDQTALIAELQSGKTLAEVITAHDVAVETVVEAFLAPRAAQVAQQVAGGQMTQAQADAMLATMRANVSARITQEWSPRGPGQGTGFVDEDGDGVCDHAGTGQGMGRGRGNGAGFVDEDGDGVCDYARTGQGMGRGRGAGFVDEDGDGVCDYAGTGRAAQ